MSLSLFRWRALKWVSRGGRLLLVEKTDEIINKIHDYQYSNQTHANASESHHTKVAQNIIKAHTQDSNLIITHPNLFLCLSSCRRNYDRIKYCIRWARASLGDLFTRFNEESEVASRLSTATRYPLDDMRAKKVRGVRQQRGERLRDKTKNKYNIYITQSRCLMQRERVSFKVINKNFI